MSDADDAYALAEKLIEEARVSGATELSFDREDLRALDRLPPEIAKLAALRWLELSSTGVSDVSPLSGLTGLEILGLSSTGVSDVSPLSGLTGLEMLNLSSTGVSDVSPLSGLTALRSLYLNSTAVSDVSPLSGLTELSTLVLYSTEVSDLRPLRNLDKLVNATDFFGLTFTNTPATRIDARIAEIAEIEDPATRAKTLFDYLEDWVPPASIAPGQDPLLPVETQNGRLETPQTSPTEAERDERLKQVLHQRLQKNAEDLARAAGNRFGRLAARARAVLRELERDFTDLDMLMLHLAVEDLRSLNTLGREEEDGESFTPEVMVPLDDVIRLGPGLTLGNPDVDLLVQRANMRRVSAQPVDEDEAIAQNQMSEAVASESQAIGPHLQRIEAEVLQGTTAEAKVVQRSVNRNVLWKIATVLCMTTGQAVGMVGVVYAMPEMSPAVFDFLAHNFQILHAAAATYGPDFYNWFAGAVAEVGKARGLTLRAPHRAPR